MGGQMFLYIHAKLLGNAGTSFKDSHKKIRSRSSGTALRAMFTSTVPRCLQGKWLTGMENVNWKNSCTLPKRIHFWGLFSNRCLGHIKTPKNPNQNPKSISYNLARIKQGWGALSIYLLVTIILPWFKHICHGDPVSMSYSLFTQCLPVSCLETQVSISPRMKTRVMVHKEIQDWTPWHPFPTPSPLFQLQ